MELMIWAGQAAKGFVVIGCMAIVGIALNVLFGG